MINTAPADTPLVSLVANRATGKRHPKRRQLGKNAVGARNFRQEIGAAEQFDDRHAGQVGRRQRNPGRSTHPRRDEYRGQRRPTSEETERRAQVAAAGTDNRYHSSPSPTASPGSPRERTGSLGPGRAPPGTTKSPTTNPQQTPAIVRPVAGEVEVKIRGFPAYLSAPRPGMRSNRR